MFVYSEETTAIKTNCQYNLILPKKHNAIRRPINLHADGYREKEDSQDYHAYCNVYGIIAGNSH